MNVTRVQDAKAPLRGLLPLLAASIALGLYTIGPGASADTGGKIVVAFAALSMASPVLAAAFDSLMKSLAVWWAVGGAIGFAILSLFGIGLWAIVPLLCVLVYAGLSLNSLTPEATLPGAFLSASMVLMVIPVV